jgi:hypothetical protein
MQLSKSHGIRVGFDAKFLDSWLKRQKYVWIIGAATLIAGLSGLLGRGPLARHTVNSEPAGIQVQYERIARNKTPSAVQVQLAPRGSADLPIRLRVQGDLVKGARLRQIMPQPLRSDLLPDGMIVEFPAALSAGVVSFVQEPSAPGRFRNKITLEGGSAVEFVQFVLP